MDTNDNTVNIVENKSLFTVKRVMRGLSFICIVFVFCPVFLVSCSGREIEVDVMTAVGGMKMYGETVVEPHPIMLICLLIPIAVLVLLFTKKLEQKQIAICSFVCMLIDFVVWIIFKSTVKKLVEQNYCTFETTGWFYANMISIILIIVLTLLVIFKIIQFNTDLIKLLTGNSKQETISRMSDAVNKMSNTVNKLVTSVTTNSGDKTANENEDRIGFCMKCGTAILYGDKFCTSCGTKVPSSVLEEAENKKKEELVRKVRHEKEEKNEVDENATDGFVTNEKAIFCQQCGTKLNTDSVFCEQCGTKVE